MKHLKQFESFVGGVNYDSVSEVILKKEVGDLSKLTPYLLEYGNRIFCDGEKSKTLRITGTVKRKAEFWNV